MSKALQTQINQFGGLFYKRKSMYFGNRKKNSFLSGLMTSFNNSMKYVKRYFMINIDRMSL